MSGSLASQMKLTCAARIEIIEMEKQKADYLICVRCNRPVCVYEKDYLLFEKMHWICFHFEFEHGDYDPDEPCQDPSCPWNRISDAGDD